LVTKAANDKFINGDINYLEWVMLINQNTEIQSNYIETVRKFNEKQIRKFNIKINENTVITLIGLFFCTRVVIKNRKRSEAWRSYPAIEKQQHLPMHK
jgi:hypothetical protein